jgi:hypothetical protein
VDIAKALDEQLGLRPKTGRQMIDMLNVVGLKSPQEVVTKQVSAN